MSLHLAIRRAAETADWEGACSASLEGLQAATSAERRDLISSAEYRVERLYLRDLILSLDEYGPSFLAELAVKLEVKPEVLAGVLGLERPT